MIFAAAMISTIVIPALVGIVFYSRVSSQVKTFVYFIIFKMMSEMFFVTTSFAGVDNIGLVHWYTILELIFLLLIFMSVFKHFYITVSILMCVSIICAFIYPNDFNVLARVIECIVMATASLIVYAKPDYYEGFAIKHGPYDDIKTLCAGLAMYYIVGTVIFHSMTRNNIILEHVAWIHIYLGVVCNLIYAAGFYQAYRINGEKLINHT